jgi:hypothetical protein
MSTRNTATVLSGIPWCLMVICGLQLNTGPSRKFDKQAGRTRRVGWGREVWGLENSVLFDCVMLCHLFCSICMRKKTQIVCSITRSLSSFSAFATKCRSATAISFSTLTCLLASSNLKTAEEIWLKRGISELTTTFVHSPVSKTFGQKQRTLDKKTRMRFCAQTERNSPSIYGSIKYSCYKLYRGMQH